MLLPAPDIDRPWVAEEMDGVQVLRLRAPRTKDIGYVRRTIGEFLMPFFMRRNFLKSPFAKTKWDGVVWYAPSIFHGPLAWFLKKSSNCRSYLIIRDIFPEWAVDMGLMGKGLPYLFFKAVARYQYSVADVIGVQTSGNAEYFSSWKERPGNRLEVLQNWLSDAPDRGCPINIGQTPLNGRKIFVYAGNMGVAQGMDILLDLADRLRERSDIGFLFVGRGSESTRLSNSAKARGLENTFFHDEIFPDEIPGLYAQCHAGIVALDRRHKSHNIPGKFLTYMQSGLPVLAVINPGNDLAQMIRQENVGVVNEDGDLNSLERQTLELISRLAVEHNIKDSCRNLYRRLFSPATAVEQIVSALQDGKKNTNPDAMK